eukprot:2371893-Amphidinium_carterae.2
MNPRGKFRKSTERSSSFEEHTIPGQRSRRPLTATLNPPVPSPNKTLVSHDLGVLSGRPS